MNRYVLFCARVRCSVFDMFQGLTTFTWTSMNIEQYLTNVTQCISSLEDVVTKANGNILLRIIILCCICICPLFVKAVIIHRLYLSIYLFFLSLRFIYLHCLATLLLDVYVSIHLFVSTYCTLLHIHCYAHTMQIFLRIVSTKNSNKFETQSCWISLSSDHWSQLRNLLNVR